MEKVENLVLKNLIHNEEYARKVIPFIKKEYFQEESNQILYEEISEFIVQYDELPSKEAVSIEVENREGLTEQTFRELGKVLSYLDKEPADFVWLCDTTERWCRDRAIYLALMESIALADGKDERKGRDAIPSILSDALAVSFDNHVGHNYLEDYEERYALYHRKEDKIPFDLEYLNKITKGGLPNKTLNIALAGTGVGKSLFMCHMASACLLQGRNVLYITLEMAEEKIAERIDANLLDIPIQQLSDPILTKERYTKKVDALKKKTQGRLVIKEYPTASAHVGHFEALLNELSLKKGFHPDIVFVDYLNICASSRYKGTVVNSYTYVKSIAEELRGLAGKLNVPIVSATQTTRSGYGNSDVELTDTSESFGLPATADLMVALISTEEMEQLGQIMVKQLKNRYNDPTVFKRFVVGIDRAKMRLYDCDQSAQDNIIDAGDISEDAFTDTKKSFDGFKV